MAKASHGIMVAVSKANTKRTKGGIHEQTKIVYHIRDENASTILCLFRNIDGKCCMRE